MSRRLRRDDIPKMWRLAVVCTHDGRAVPIDAFMVVAERLSLPRPPSNELIAANGHDDESFYGIRSTRPNPDMPVGGEVKPSGGTKWRGRCGQCRPRTDVTLRWAAVDRLVAGCYAAGKRSVELRDLAHHC